MQVTDYTQAQYSYHKENMYNQTHIHMCMRRCVVTQKTKGECSGMDTRRDDVNENEGTWFCRSWHLSWCFVFVCRLSINVERLLCVERCAWECWLTSRWSCWPFRRQRTADKGENWVIYWFLKRKHGQDARRLTGEIPLMWMMCCRIVHQWGLMMGDVKVMNVFHLLMSN